MPRLRRISLSWKLTKIVVVVALLIGTILNLLQILLDFRSEEKRAERIVSQIIDSVLPLAADVAYKLDSSGAAEIVNGLKRYDFIEQAVIFEDTGKTLATGGTPCKQNSSSLWLTRLFFPEFSEKRSSLLRNGTSYSFGSLYLKINNDIIYRELYVRLINVFLSGLTRSLLLTLVLIGIFYVILTRPLKRIAAFFSAIDPGNERRSRLPLPPGHEKDEVGEIVSRANFYLDRAEEHMQRSEKARALLEENSRYLRTILNTAAEGFISTDEYFMVSDANPSMENILGLQKDAIVGKSLIVLAGEHQEKILEDQIKKMREGQHSTYRVNLKHASGREVPCFVSAMPMTGEHGEYLGSFGFVTDITETVRAEKERESLQAQLLQSQKLEAIGTLAGGIAHDFNNILGAVVGYSEIVRDDLPPDSPSIHDIDQVLKASHRAKDLVKQILAFSRQVEAQKIPVQLAIIANEAITLLRSSLPSTITITQDIDSEAGMVLADPTQIHQVVMNLATNAFHAMEAKGGVLNIAVHHKVLSENELASAPDLQPGTYVQLSIRDTGTGILPEIREWIFDPFFTTKEAGKGTGLGLSMVFNIVKSCRGAIACDSHMGEGTEFRILLPALEGQNAPEENGSSDIVPRGEEHILFIDDEEMLVEMGKTMFERLGYQVTTRKNSLEALTTFQAQPDSFDLIITDQTMPSMTGIDLARCVLQIRPQLPIILCTGYSSQIVEETAKDVGIKGFAYKPLAKKRIGELIRKVLDEKKL